MVADSLAQSLALHTPLYSAARLGIEAIQYFARQEITEITNFGVKYRIVNIMPDHGVSIGENRRTPCFHSGSGYL
jgi:hypothetical protein